MELDDWLSAELQLGDLIRQAAEVCLGSNLLCVHCIFHLTEHKHANLNHITPLDGATDTAGLESMQYCLHYCMYNSIFYDIP